MIFSVNMCLLLRVSLTETVFQEKRDYTVTYQEIWVKL